MLVVLIVVAAVVVALGLQILSRHVQRFPIDGRRPDLLIDVSEKKVVNARPAELHRLIGIMGDALSSQTIAKNELEPRLHQLAHDAPKPVVLAKASAAGKRRGFGRKGPPVPIQLEEQLVALEVAWDVAPADDSN